jgi:hypothetical protein
MERVSADEIATELLDLRGDGAVTVILAVGLAPADDAGIGGEAHEHEILAPAGMDRKAFDGGDLHRAMLSLVIAGPDPAIHRLHQDSVLRNRWMRGTADKFTQSAQAWLRSRA